jgi:hypothetical protein
MKLRILVCSLVLAFAGSASALTLADLSAGASFNAGPLSFGHFVVTPTGSVDSNLADYQVQTLTDGFRILGGLGVFDGDQGSLHVAFDVTDSSPGGADGLAFQFDGAASGKGSGAMVTESVSDTSNNHVASASVFASGGAQLSNTAGFGGAQSDFHVEEGVILKSVGLASAAGASSIDDQFTAMPEPGTLLLLAAGMTGLFVMSRKRGY